MELTTPMVTELSSPSGFPKANTSDPCLSSSHLQTSGAGYGPPSIFSTARSDSRSVPTTRAGPNLPCLRTTECRPGPNSSAKESWTRTCSAPCTTWLLVTRYPSALKITADPELRCFEKSAAFSPLPSPLNEYPVEKTWTTDRPHL